MEERDAKKAGDKKALHIFIIVLIGLAVAVALYSFGFVNGRSRVGELRGQLAVVQETLAIAEEQRDVAIGRASLYRAALDLEERNFGKAQEHLSEAAKALKALPPGGGKEGEQIREIQKLVEQTKIGVSTDVGQQRADILKLAKRLDDLQP